MPKRTRDYHAWLLKRLAEPREAERYLKTAMADSSEMFLKALRNVAEANRMAKVAEGAGVSRESLYRTLSEDGNPRFDTLNSVLDTLGIQLTVKLKQPVSLTTLPPEGADIVVTTTSGLILTGAATTTATNGQIDSRKMNDYLTLQRKRNIQLQGPAESSKILVAA